MIGRPESRMLSNIASRNSGVAACARRKRTMNCTALSTASPSTTLATRLVVRFNSMPRQPMKPKKNSTGIRLGTSAVNPTRNEPNSNASMK
ncbi:MAG: hypothetical protein JMDDDDMK_03104 [Acidobacteria bacterium]|nr:hypothetical protein [Acidobacteriota bacterium]